MIPRETPVNQKTNQKSVPYKIACPKFYFQAQARSSSKLVSYRLAGLDICLTCTYPTCPGDPKGFGEENLVPGHGQDFNTLLCTARNEPKIALSNDWPRRHFVKNAGSYKMIRPTKNTPFTKWHGSLGKIPDKMPPFVTKMSSEMGPAISLRNCDARLYWKRMNHNQKTRHYIIFNSFV